MASGLEFFSSAPSERHSHLVDGSFKRAHGPARTAIFPRDEAHPCLDEFLVDVYYTGSNRLCSLARPRLGTGHP